MRALLVTYAFLVAALLSSLPLRACRITPPRGVKVTVASESAIIVWNAATHTEQFIRRADFNSSTADFGFLVPTPTVPILSASHDEAFKVLEATYHPPLKVHERRRLAFVPFMALAVGSRPSMPHVHDVDVVNAQHVAGYDAVVLKANNAAAMTTWLSQHGYQSDTALTAWLQPYVDRHWAITAFKVVKPDPNSPKAGLTPVRMTFQTARPFYPYREGVDQQAPGAHAPKRLLRIFFVGDQRVLGTLDGVATPWPGHPLWSGAYANDKPYAFDPYRDLKDLGGDLAAALNLGRADVPPIPWLTVFEDTSSPRPGIADLYFTPSLDQSKMVPATVDVPWNTNYGIPVEFVVFGLFVAIAIFRKWRAYLGLDPVYTDVQAPPKQGCFNDILLLPAFVLTCIVLVVFTFVVPIYI